MKQLLILFLMCLYLAACRKETARDKVESYLEHVKASLKDSMGVIEFDKLDFESAILSEEDSINLHVLKVPYYEGKYSTRFVLVQTDANGTVLKGKIVSLVRRTNSASINNQKFDGYIEMSSLRQEIVLSSNVENGFVAAYHPSRRKPADSRLSSAQLVQPSDNMLPEVIVIGYRESSGGISYSDWISLQGMFGGGGGGGYYSPAGGSGEGGNYGGSSSGYHGGGGGGGSVQQVPPIQIDFENQGENPAIDIEAYLRCFGSIPDAGATCSIEIFADIPVDKDPNKLLDISTASPGHTYIQIKKTNGAQSVMQNIGFYPKSGWKTALTPAPVEGKFADNGGHEFNASFLMNLSPAQLQSVLIRIQNLSRFIKYDIDEYNCTDFALDLFNEARVDKLDIPLYDIPGSITGGGTRTPQGLFNKLKSMQQSGSAEASNITVPGYKGWVASSNGPCN